MGDRDGRGGVPARLNFRYNRFDRQERITSLSRAIVGDAKMLGGLREVNRVHRINQMRQAKAIRHARACALGSAPRLLCSY